MANKHIPHFIKIAREYPQFKGERALLVLAGTQDAEFYLLGDGTMERVEMFRIPRMRYTDREGLSVRRTRSGKEMVTGGGENPVKEMYAQEFTAKFKQTVKTVIDRTSPSEIILMSLENGDIEPTLPVAARRKIVLKIAKHMCERHPEEILGQLKRAMAK